MRESNVVIAGIPSDRDVYANLLRDTRAMRRDQSTARDSWFAALAWDQKEHTLFELEMLLKGVVCFGNPANHPGPPRQTAAVAHDFREELRILRDAFDRVNDLVRQLLGDRERAYTFSRYLETVLPEDTARGRLIQEQLTQDTPEESLFVLRNAFGAFSELAEALLKAQRVGHRPYVSLHGIVTREVGRNVYFNPLMALEFRPEFDRIRSAEVLEALDNVKSETAHRVLALAMLTFFRGLRYVDLVDEYAAEPGSARRAYVILSVLRSDLRTLTRYLARRAGDAIADGLERDLMAIPAVEIASSRSELEAEARYLSAIRNTLESVASALRTEVRRVFGQELPPLTRPVGAADLSPQLVLAAATIRAALHHGVEAVCRSLAPQAPSPMLALDHLARRAAAERLRREVWMFMQILRAFAAKASAADPSSDRWAGAASFQFVRDFLNHFRAIGYQLVRANDYPRLDEFLSALEGLRDVDLIERDRLAAAVDESQRFYKFLEVLFLGIGQRAELSGVAFDRKTAVEALKIYLGKG
ncbi:MAG: hypothetical protein K8H88_15090 [Sandaracinaceae bacterium]|nr:hypothetical protein [Sandaracinaceae bacterium]